MGFPVLHALHHVAVRAGALAAAPSPTPPPSPAANDINTIIGGIAPNWGPFGQVGN